VLTCSQTMKEPALTGSSVQWVNSLGSGMQAMQLSRSATACHSSAAFHACLCLTPENKC